MVLCSLYGRSTCALCCCPALTCFNQQQTRYVSYASMPVPVVPSEHSDSSHNEMTILRWQPVSPMGRQKAMVKFIGDTHHCPETLQQIGRHRPSWSRATICLVIETKRKRNSKGDINRATNWLVQAVNIIFIFFSWSARNRLLRVQRSTIDFQVNLSALVSIKDWSNVLYFYKFSMAI